MPPLRTAAAPPRPQPPRTRSLEGLLAAVRAGAVLVVDDARVVRAIAATGIPVIDATGPCLARDASPCHIPALTVREAEVARLAAHGASSPRIADALGIGVRTVETHLDHAYRKLGVRSRAELRDAIDVAAAS